MKSLQYDDEGEREAFIFETWPGDYRWCDVFPAAAVASRLHATVRVNRSDRPAHSRHFPGSLPATSRLRPASRWSKMSGLQGLKQFVSRRLSAALEEIFGHVERTITEYEREMNRRHRKLLDEVLTPEVKQGRTGRFCSFCYKHEVIESRGCAKLTFATPYVHSMLAAASSC